MSQSLEFTGERFTPECVREIWYEHLHRYAYARELVGGKKVLDAACGEGYGSALLATVASEVCGVDVSADAVGHARSRYESNTLRFQQADCCALPFADNEFDCIVSFETIEHLEDHDGLMNEFRRVVKPDGFLLISSPDKAVYTDQQKNENEFHVRELYRPEFESLLGRYFPAYRMLGQKLVFQSAIWTLGEAGGVDFLQENEGQVGSFSELQHDPVYLIAICALEASCLPEFNGGMNVFDDARDSVYEHYYQEIRKHIAAGELLAERDKELDVLRQELGKQKEKLRIHKAEREGPKSAWWRRWFKTP